jgi:hypothetical protein
MIDKKYSSQSFSAKGLDTDESRKLADELAEAVQNEMKLVAKSKLEEIIKKLNELEYTFSLCDELGDYLSYCSEVEREGVHYKLKIDFDIVIATGYAHLLLMENNSLEEEDGNFC